MNNIQKAIRLIFPIIIGLFYSCGESTTDVGNKLDLDKEARKKIETLFMTPDSLRSEEEKVLFQQIELMAYENWIIENDRFVTTISKKKLKERGLPEVLFDMMTKDIDDLNNSLDTMTLYKQLALDSYSKNRKEYFEKRKSQHRE